MICLQSVYLAKAKRLSENFSRHLRAQLSQKVAARLGLLERCEIFDNILYILKYLKIYHDLSLAVVYCGSYAAALALNPL